MIITAAQGALAANLPGYAGGRALRASCGMSGRKSIVPARGKRGWAAATRRVVGSAIRGRAAIFGGLTAHRSAFAFTAASSPLAGHLAQVVHLAQGVSTGKGWVYPQAILGRHFLQAAICHEGRQRGVQRLPQRGICLPCGEVFVPR
jgi:hypothetical protein